MNDVIARFLADLRSVQNVGTQYEMINRWAASGETELLYELAIALEAHAPRLYAEGWTEDRLLGPWAVEAVVDRIERVLALTAGISHAEALLRLSLINRQSTVQEPTMPHRNSGQRLRLFASLLASAQGTDVLVELFQRHCADERFSELLSLLVQEMVLRNAPCQQMPVIQAHFETMLSRGHSLAWLPVSLTDIETELALPHYHVQGSSCSLPFGPVKRRAGYQHHSRSGVAPTIKETTNGQESRRIRSAVLNWEEESNGVSEARTYKIEPPISRMHISPAVLCSWRLTCLRDASPDDIHLEMVSPNRVFSILFAAASKGGAYNDGRYGAYGRYEAWRSLAGLMGASEEDSVRSLVERAKQCDWLYFDAASDWFWQVAWDLGIIAVHSNGRSIAVMAATDTD